MLGLRLNQRRTNAQHGLGARHGLWSSSWFMELDMVYCTLHVLELGNAYGSLVMLVLTVLSLVLVSIGVKLFVS